LITSDQTPTITGTCEANLGLKIAILPTSEFITSTCSGLGGFSITPSTSLPYGIYSVSVEQRDLAGNESLSGVAGGTIIPSDTDGDGVPDFVEATQSTNLSDPTSYLDTDGDLVPDYIESLDGTNPNDKNSFRDTDGGGVPDYVEQTLFVSKGLTTSNINTQADDLRDTDGDGLSDYKELLYGTNPLAADTDGDGSNDKIESENPNNGDLDNNGIPDGAQNSISTTAGVDNSHIALLATGDCNQISDLRSIQQNNVSSADSTYTYPLGFLSYTLNCTNLGGQANVKIYYLGKTDSPDYKVRKLNNGVYSEVTSATKNQVNLFGTQAIEISLSATDGAQLDNDNLTNRQIVDPIGLALPSTNPTQPSINTLFRTGGSGEYK
jgi:hypothetical protein